MHKRIAVVLLISIMICVAKPASCWGITGHRTIAEISQNHLSKKAKREISKLIGKQSLAQWANWADFIKSDSLWDHADKWHYVNIAGNMSKDSFLVSLKEQTGVNLYTQIKAMSAELKNKSLSDEQRRIALYFLVHLIGDLHQPLHVGRAADQGGNKVSVTWFDRKTNLHSLWDTQLVEHQQYSYTEYAKILDIAASAQVKSWQSGTLEDWLYESHEIANTIYEATPNDSRLSYRYNYQFQQVLDRQLLKGGVRLAQVLNELFN